MDARGGTPSVSCGTSRAHLKKTNKQPYFLTRIREKLSSLTINTCSAFPFPSWGSLINVPTVGLHFITQPSLPPRPQWLRHGGVGLLGWCVAWGMSMLPAASTVSRQDHKDHKDNADRMLTMLLVWSISVSTKWELSSWIGANIWFLLCICDDKLVINSHYSTQALKG